MEADNEPVTPTKSLRGKPPVKASTSTENGPSTPTYSSGRKSARLSTIALQLMSASHESSKAAKDEEMSPGADKTRVNRSSPRKSATRMDVPPEPSKTPTKSIRAKGKEKAPEAFEQAMAQKTPTKTRSAIKTTSGKPSVDYSKPYVAVKLEADVESKQEEEVPPETYWGDMLIRYRRKVDVEARQQKTEAWRQSMLRRLDLTL